MIKVFMFVCPQRGDGEGNIVVLVKYLKRNIKEPQEPQMQNIALLPRMHPEEKRGDESLRLI